MFEKVCLSNSLAPKEREELKISLHVSFQDIYDALECAWENVRTHEEEINRVLFGDGVKEAFRQWEEMRSKRINL